MTEVTHHVLRSLVPVICPPEAAPLADAIVDHMQLTLAASPPLLARGLDAAMYAYDVGALPRYFRRARALTGERAERYFASWEHGLLPQVQLARALKQLMSLSCYEQPAMMAAVGYHPVPWIEAVTKKRLTVFADDLKKQDEQLLAPDPLRAERPASGPPLGPVTRGRKKEVA